MEFIPGGELEGRNKKKGGGSSLNLKEFSMKSTM